MNNDTADAPVAWRELLTRDYMPALALVCLGIWLHAADSLVVSTMMPAIVAELGGASLIHWSVALYEIGSITFGASAGLLVIRAGVHKPMAVAAGLFALGCMISALAPAMWLLLLGRLLQGLGGGGLFSLSFVAVSLFFPRRLSARVMGAVSTLWAVSAFLGPLIGGLFVDLASWRLGFGFFAMQAVLLAIGIGFAAQRSSATELNVQSNEALAERFPVVRLLWLCAGVTLISLAASEPAAVRTALLAAGGVICLWVFLRRDARALQSRLLPVKAFRMSTPVGAALLLVLCFGAATIALSLYGPVLMTAVHGLSALQAGMILAGEAVVWTLAAVMLSGRPERYDGITILIGVSIVAVSVVGLAYSVAQGPVWLIVLCAALQGGGFGTAWTFILRRVVSLAPREDRERVSAAVPTVQRVGYALGAAWVGFVANSTGFAAAVSIETLQSISSRMFMACVPLAVVGLLAAWRFVRFPVSHHPDSASKASRA